MRDSAGLDAGAKHGPEPAAPEATRILLHRWQQGSLDARDELVKRLHPDLAEIAAARLRRERDSSLSTGDLINQVVLRMIRADGLALTDRAHFVALSSRMMRNILVDHARAKASAKRGHVRVELCTSIDGGKRIDLISLESALIRLKVLDAQLMEIVEMRYFGGMTVVDIAVVLDVSEPTVKRRWQVARAWLADALASQPDCD
jgi:RNA polymerase sigma factor (TIGR02999 family)